jgi:hypothetical protein
MTPLIIPATGFAGRAQGIFVETGLIFAGSAAIALGNISTDRADGPVQLIGQANGALIFYQLGYVMPCQITSKDSKPIDLHPPKRVIGEFWRDGSQPLVVSH